MRVGFVSIVIVALFGAVVSFGNQWVPFGGPYCARNIVDIGYGPGNPNVIYCVNLDSCLAKSIDEAFNWQILTPGPCGNAGIRCVAAHPGDANTVYKGLTGSTAENKGIWQSTDGGQSWTARNNGLPSSIDPTKMVIFPDQPNRMALGMVPYPSEVSLYWSSNGGNDWFGATIVEKGFQVTDLCINPGIPGCIYASAGGGSPNNGVYRSTDHGASWSPLNPPPQPNVSCIAASNVGGNTYLFAGFPAPDENEGGGIERSINGGQDWTVVFRTPDAGVPVTDVVVDPTNPSQIFASTGRSPWSYAKGAGVYRSTDAGATWQAYNLDLADKYVLSLACNPSGRLSAGTFRTFYYNYVDMDQWWEERVKGMLTADLGHVFPRLPDIRCFSCNGVYLHNSSQGGWRTTTTVAGEPITEIHSAAAHPTDPARLLMGWGASWVPDHVPTPSESISLSTDGGWTWQNRWGPAEGLLTGTNAIVYALSNPQTVYSGLARDYLVLKSQDGGLNWSETSRPPFFSRVMDIAVRPDNDQVLYICDFDGYQRVWRSDNGGASWDCRSNGLPYNILSCLEMDPYRPDVLYAGYFNYELNAIYKTVDAGQNWIARSRGLTALPAPCVRAMFLDPTEPSILYASITDALTGLRYVYQTVDGGSMWFDISAGTAGHEVASFGLDSQYPNRTYAATKNGLYYYDVPFEKSLVSSSDTATSYNNARKIVRVEGTNEVWITYESGEVIYAVQTMNAGVNPVWSRKMEVGAGCHPAIVLDPVTNRPCLIWRGIDGRSIQFSRYDGSAWTGPVIVYQGSPAEIVGPPSFAVSCLAFFPVGHVAFNMEEPGFEGVLYGDFLMYNPAQFTPTTVDIGQNIGLASIAYNYDWNQIHIAYDYDSYIVTRYSSDGGASWSLQSWVSQVDASHYPSIEPVGSGIHYFWEGAGPGNNPDIYSRYRYFDGIDWWWSEVMRVNYSDGASRYPTSIGGFSCCWAEGQGWRIHISRYDPMIGEWLQFDPVNREESGFPHMVLKQVPNEKPKYWLTWTENAAAPYDIAFQEWVPPDPPFDQPFYVEDAGQNSAGPFMQKRSGFTKYGTEAYKTVDHDGDLLEYKMGKFNPKKPYRVEGTFYHEGVQNTELSFEIDGRMVGKALIPPKTMKKLSAMVPLALYQDSIIDVKVKCLKGQAVLGVLVAYEYDAPQASAGRGGGTQSAENSLLIPGNFVLSCAPNPFRDLVAIRYQLPADCRVSVEVFDVCGKVIRRFAEGKREAGHHAVTWNGENDKGNVLANGVYFCRIIAGDHSQTKKLLLLR